MKDIGKRLREARERLGLTLDEAERATRIRSHHLEALELGDLDALPSSVQARGFLRNYADFLGLDVEDVMLAYADALQALSHAPHPAIVPESDRPTRPSRRRLGRWLSTDFFISAGIVLAVLIVLLWGGSRLMTVMRQQTEAAEQGGASDTPPASPTLTPTPAATPAPAESAQGLISPVATATPTFAPLGVPVAGINLRLLGEKRSWVQISVDGRVRFTGMMLPGDIREYSANASIELTTGDAGGVHAFFNGQDQGVLGDIGQVAIRLWTSQGMITPTPTVTSTPTPTLPPTRTLIPTRTLVPTRTLPAP